MNSIWIAYFLILPTIEIFESESHLHRMLFGCNVTYISNYSLNVENTPRNKESDIASNMKVMFLFRRGRIVYSQE